jgi:hypothetical protein
MTQQESYIRRRAKEIAAAWDEDYDPPDVAEVAEMVGKNRALRLAKRATRE